MEYTILILLLPLLSFLFLGLAGMKLKPAAAGLVGNHRAASGAEIGDFIQYDTLHSCN